MDINLYINNLLDHLHKNIQEETDDYKLALLNRSYSNTKAVNHLIEGDFFIEAPVLLRVSFEHLCRLYLYNQDPEGLFKNNLNALKLISKTPSPQKAFEYFGDEIKLIYEMLCAFSHPDLFSMVINSNQDKNVKNTCKVFISLSLLVNTVILLEVYPDQEKETQEVIIDDIQQILLYYQNEINNFITPELIGNFEIFIQENPLMQDPFKNNHLNESLTHMMELYKDEEGHKKIAQIFTSLDFKNEKDLEQIISFFKRK